VDPSGLPSVEQLRWPILVALDAVGEDEVLDLEGRVADHLGISAEVRAIPDPDTGRPMLIERMMQAIDDLYQADAIEPDDETQAIRITDVGRRFTEGDVRDLPAGVAPDDGVAASQDAEPPASEKPSITDWVFAFLDSWI
jgi:hypothetical protein